MVIRQEIISTTTDDQRNQDPGFEGIIIISSFAMIIDAYRTGDAGLDEEHLSVKRSSLFSSLCTSFWFQADGEVGRLVTAALEWLWSQTPIQEESDVLTKIPVISGAV